MTRFLIPVLVIFALGCHSQNPETRAAPDAVRIRGQLNYELVVATESNELLGHIRIETQSLADTARPPVNLALVLDTSGSMAGEAIENARDASLAFLETLRPDDRVTVVVFHSEGEVLLPSSRVEDADTDSLRNAIAGMQARGTTEMAQGIQLALNEMMNEFDPQGVNRMVILSDGVPNNADAVMPLVNNAANRSIRMTTLGLGLDYDETLLGHMARQTGGRFHYVEDSSRVADVFRTEVLRFERLVAQNAQLWVQPGPGVRLTGAPGYQPSIDARGRYAIALGDLSEGDHRDCVFVINAAARQPGATVEVLDALLTYDDALEGTGRVQRRVFLAARATNDESERRASHHPEVERMGTRMRAAAATLLAVAQARGGDVTQAQQTLDAEIEAGASPEETQQMRELQQALPNAFRPEGRAVPPTPTEPQSSAPSQPPAAVVRSAHAAAMAAVQGTD